LLCKEAGLASVGLIAIDGRGRPICSYGTDRKKSCRTV
jgi:hypothetical protein